MHIWFDFLRSLPGSIQTWMSEISLQGFDARNIYLHAKTPFHVLWFQEHVKPLFTAFLQEHKKRVPKVHFETSSSQKGSLSLEEKMDKDTSANPFYRMENFLFSEDNQALKHALEQIDLPVPVVIYGTKGVGKTHLLHALAHKYSQDKKQIRVVNTQQFVWHFTTALRTKQLDAFRHHYRTCDLLLMDDIDHIAGKKASMEEFFYLFNALHLSGIPMIFTSSQAPGKIEQLEDRISSRLSWGLALALRPLHSKETSSLLRRHAENLKIDLKEDAWVFFEQKFAHPYLALQAFESLAIRVHQKGLKHALSYQDLESLLLDLIETKKELCSDDILKQVAQVFSISTEELVSSSKRFAKPRKLAMYLCRTRLGLTYVAIAKLFAKNHSTVISAIRQVENNQDKDLVHHLQEALAQRV